MTDRPWSIEWTEAGSTRRFELRGVLAIGRAEGIAIRVADPYISRQHCVISLVDGRPVVDATGSLNRIRVAGDDFSTVTLSEGDVFVLGKTAFRVGRAAADTTTLILRTPTARLLLRRSTRELLDHEGTLIAQFSVAEFAAFEATAARYPDAASHAEVAQAVWGSLGYDQYQIHRLMQRVRQRLGDAGDLLENVRGAGYRLGAAVEAL